jgi:hypothetical protein
VKRKPPLKGYQRSTRGGPLQQSQDPEDRAEELTKVFEGKNTFV